MPGFCKFFKTLITNSRYPETACLRSGSWGWGWWGARLSNSPSFIYNHFIPSGLLSHSRLCQCCFAGRSPPDCQCQWGSYVYSLLGSIKNVEWEKEVWAVTSGGTVYSYQHQKAERYQLQGYRGGEVWADSGRNLC